MVRGMNLRAACILSMFGLICGACGAETAEDTNDPGPPAALSLSMRNGTDRDWAVQLTYEATAPQGEPMNGALFAAVSLASGAVAEFPSAVRSTVGASVVLTAAAWSAETPDFRRGATYTLTLDAPHESCAVEMLPVAGEPPGLALSCSR